MALRLLAASALGVLFLLSAPVGAEHLRFELGAAPSLGVPRTFEQLRQRVLEVGGAISWEDPPYFDPYYAVSGGATYASITFGFEQDSITVTWTEFEDLAAAAQHEAEFVTSYGATGWVRFVRSGARFLQAYSNNGDPDVAGRALERIAGG